MRVFKEKDIHKIPGKSEFVSSIKELSDRKLSHLFTLSEEELSNVLTALSYYCEHKGAKATKKAYEDTLLQMIQYQDGACGHRFLLWAM